LADHVAMVLRFDKDERDGSNESEDDYEDEIYVFEADMQNVR
jgi:hypothetical protein